MTLIKKTIILSKNGAKGYVTIIRVGSSVGIKVVLNIFDKGLLIGIKIGSNKLLVRELKEKVSEYNIDDCITFYSNDDLSCLIINSENNVFAEGGLKNRIRINDIVQFINQSKIEISENTKSVINENNQTKEIDAEKRYSSNRNINYENYKQREFKNLTFNKMNTSFDNTQNLADSFEFSKEISNFYLSIKDKIDELFVIYPRERILENIIPESKWVRINYDGDDFYVAGVLVDEENKVSHIAYGVPGYEGIQPPKGTENICDWLPVQEMQKYNGYWLIFQNAENGEILPKE